MTQFSVTGFGPASIGNLAVGFDILGLSLSGIYDEVTLTKRTDREIKISNIKGVTQNLPKEAHKNTCGAALLAFQDKLNLNYGFDIAINKGIPLASGMGGSAASAVATVIAANHFLSQPLEKNELLEFALAGEQVASGSAHLDNVAPSLLGGLCLCLKNNKVIKIPTSSELNVVIFHPHIQVETKVARSILKDSISLNQYIEQSQYLAGFISACYEGDFNLIAKSLKDVVIEPQRSKLIPHFYQYQQEVLKVDGVLGCSISGAGPTMFALTNSDKSSLAVKQTFEQVAKLLNQSGKCWKLKINDQGAYTNEVH
ncbi:MAG: homoserine kinase [Bdellovibrionales bacterium]|nr:homoserine kinase [Bdellovibrionales bacterium]